MTGAIGSRRPRRRPILVAGIGSIGSRHVRNLRALGYNQIVLYRTGQGTFPVEPGLPTVSTLDEGLDRDPIAVIVSNPTAHHLPTALRAAAAGAHLLIEKPLSNSLDGVDDLRRTVAQQRLAALVGYQLRFHPTLRTVRSWVRDGRVGSVVTALARWGEYLPGWHPWEDHRASYAAVRSLGGGVIHTLSHPIDYLVWLLGPVVAVQAMADNRCELDVDCEDVAHLTLRMESGAIASVVVDYARYPQVHRLEIVGSRGVIDWDMHSGVATLTERAGREVSKQLPITYPPFDRNSLFVREMRHFLACIDGRDVPACTLDDGAAALRVALAAHRSVREGRPVLLGPSKVVAAEAEPVGGPPVRLPAGAPGSIDARGQPAGPLPTPGTVVPPQRTNPLSMLPERGMVDPPQLPRSPGV